MRKAQKMSADKCQSFKPSSLLSSKFKRADISAVAAGRVGNGGEIVGPFVVALVKFHFEAVTLVDGRTAGEQRLSWCNAAIHLQRAEERVYRAGFSADLVGIYAVGETSAAVYPVPIRLKP